MRFTRSIVAVLAAGALFACGGDRVTGSDGAPFTASFSALSPTSTAPGARIRTTAIANIRNAAKASATLLGTQPAGAVGTVVAGPVTDATGDKLTRWQINFDTGVDGWAAQDYLDQTASAPAPAPAKFTVGQRVQGANGGANVRSAPKASATQVGTQPDASAGFVVAGPVLDSTGDKLVRWQINFDTGVDGWAAQDYLAASTVPAPAASVVITPDTATVIIGATKQLAAVARDAMGANLQNASFAWSSTDTMKVKVTAAGLVTAAAAGTVFIVARSGGVADTATITSAPVPVASVTVSPASNSLVLGDSVQLTATAKDSAGATLSGRAFAWTSSDTAVASVSTNGKVHSKKSGSATITATSTVSGSAALVVTVPPPPTRPGWYVSPTGTASGDGSINHPWNFATAANGASSRILPGDTVWMRGGTYRGPFRVTVSGAPGSPVVFRQYPGERAIIDGAGTSSSVSVFYVGGQYTMFWGFEITNSDPIRTTTSTANNVRPNVVSNYASHTKYVALVVHDGGVAFYNEPVYGDVEITGCLVYNNGWQGPDRGHGHGLYLKSNTGPVVARDNVIFNQFGYGIHAYSNAGSGDLVNLHFEGNVAFNNGTLSSIGTSSNILLGGDSPARADVLLNNYTWFASAGAGTNVKIGYGSLLNGDVQVQGNYFVGGSPVLDVGYWTTFVASSNLFAGTGSILNLRNVSTIGQSLTGNTTVMPTTTQVFVRAVPYEAGRANVIVYNFGHQGSVTADLSGVLAAGDRYVVRNVQDLFGTPVATGTYSGGSISLPMSGVNAPAPVGISSRAPKTGPDFDVFVVTKN